MRDLEWAQGWEPQPRTPPAVLWCEGSKRRPAASRWGPPGRRNAQSAVNNS